jgi:hypothetical protein
MKIIPVILGTALTSLTVGCVAAPVALAPVGPNPFGRVNGTANGQMEVFSALQARYDGNDPSWYQHMDYNVYDLNGKRVRHVFNTVGHYEEAPRAITLPPGEYIVRALAKNYQEVEVPVVIEAGRITRVHLDAQWKPAAPAPQTELVDSPAGYPIGWRTQPAKDLGMN